MSSRINEIIEEEFLRANEEFKERIADTIKSHCKECNQELEISYVKVDTAFDLHVEVAPCESCIVDKENEIEDLQDTIKRLEDELEHS